jgi:hypothetical protein
MSKSEMKMPGYIYSVSIEDFCQQAELRGFKKKKAIEAAIRTWITLPAEIQVQIITSKTKEEIKEIFKKIKG